VNLVCNSEELNREIKIGSKLSAKHERQISILEIFL
jgi:hypothetical protein